MDEWASLAAIGYCDMGQQVTRSNSWVTLFVTCHYNLHAPLMENASDLLDPGDLYRQPSSTFMSLPLIVTMAISASGKFHH